MAGQGKRFSAVGGIVVIAGIAGTAILSETVAAQAQRQEPAAAVERALDAEGPILTPAEQSMIDSRCGYATGTRNDDNLRIEDDGVLVCANGRRVGDPEVRALAGRVGKRIEARVSAVMRRPEVRAAMRGEIEARVREQLRDIEPKIAAARVAASAAFGPAERARLRADLDRVRRDIERIDVDAIERQVDEAFEREPAA